MDVGVIGVCADVWIRARAITALAGLQAPGASWRCRTPLFSTLVAHPAYFGLVPVFVGKGFTWLVLVASAALFFTALSLRLGLFGHFGHTRFDPAANDPLPARHRWDGT